MPRTPDGKPDLQGNWTNETQTPLERHGRRTAATLTDEQAAAIEKRALDGRGVSRQGQRSEPSGAAQGRRSRQLAAPGQHSFIERSRKPPAARSAAITASGSIPAST